MRAGLEAFRVISKDMKDKEGTFMRLDGEDLVGEEEVAMEEVEAVVLLEARVE